MIPKPLDASVAAQIINSLSHWHVHAPTAPDVLAAIDIHRRTGASFWDAMILRSAQELRCPTVDGIVPTTKQRPDDLPVRLFRIGSAGPRSASGECFGVGKRPVALD
jgi:hypothetical protein